MTIHGCICRMWQSTQVAAHKFVSDDNVATKVDTMIDSAQRFVQQYRRISYKQLEPILLCLENEGASFLFSRLHLYILYIYCSTSCVQWYYVTQILSLAIMYWGFCVCDVPSMMLPFKCIHLIQLVY